MQVGDRPLYRSVAGPDVPAGAALCCAVLGFFRLYCCLIGLVVYVFSRERAGLSRHPTANSL